MKTGESIFAYLMKNLLFDVAFSGFMDGVYQGLYSFYLERKEDFMSLWNSAMEEMNQS